MPDERYLYRNHNTWGVVVEVPKHLRKAAGRARFKRSLHTTDLKLADKLKHSVVAEFHRRIAELARKGGDAKAALVADALALADDLRRARNEPSHPDYDDDDVKGLSRQEAMDRIRERAEELEQEQGPEAAALFVRTATGKATHLGDLLPRWLRELEGQIAGQTISQHEAACERLIAAAEGEPKWSGVSTVEELTRKRAGEYVAHLIGASGLSRKTIKRHLSSLASFWKWTRSRGIVDADARNPWHEHEVGSGKRNDNVGRKGLADADLVKLLSGSYSTEQFRQTLHDLLRLALVCGARLDELCALRRDDVERREDGWWFQVRKGKTDAAARVVPVHGAAASIIKRRMASDDEFLFPGLEPGGPDKKRSWYVSKAYGRFRKKVGVGARWQDFHALRSTFIDMMEGNEVPKDTVKLIVGHKRTDLTFGGYSKGQRIELRKVIEKVKYSVQVMKLIRQSEPRGQNGKAA